MRGRKRNRPNPAAGSKLATNVYDQRRSRIAGRPPGRPRKSDDLKVPFLSALRRFGSIGEAMDFCGISDTVVERWKREQPGDYDGDGSISFATEMAQAMATPRMRLLEGLHDRMFGDPEKNIPPDYELMQWAAARTTDAFGKRHNKQTSEEAAREIREFITGAQLSQRGVDNPNAIPRFNDDEDADERDERAVDAAAATPDGGQAPPPEAAAS